MTIMFNELHDDFVGQIIVSFCLTKSKIILSDKQYDNFMFNELYNNFEWQTIISICSTKSKRQIVLSETI